MTVAFACVNHERAPVATAAHGRTGRRHIAALAAFARGTPGAASSHPLTRMRPPSAAGIAATNAAEGGTAAAGASAE